MILGERLARGAILRLGGRLIIQRRIGERLQHRIVAMAFDYEQRGGAGSPQPRRTDSGRK